MQLSQPTQQQNQHLSSQLSQKINGTDEPDSPRFPSNALFSLCCHFCFDLPVFRQSFDLRLLCVPCCVWVFDLIWFSVSRSGGDAILGLLYTTLEPLCAQGEK
ncbi:hypothetical protein C1H46_016586 [Malus baccata]|uniref:Uncharacterized protein n=1 Tax=Malus baccata TaxID=106549 RepID=A0A540MGD6_MALBA|nr:hypothetical protein C1H46_016586 [Malus baccata]